MLALEYKYLSMAFGTPPPDIAYRRNVYAQAVQAAGHRIEIGADCALVDSMIKPLSPAEMAVLRTLAQNPGVVVAPDDLLRSLPGSGASTHAVETAVYRLRTALGDKDIVASVNKRGYRLALDEYPGAP